MKKTSKREKIKLLLQLNRSIAGVANNITEILNNMDNTALAEDAEEFENFKKYLTSQIDAFKEKQLIGMIDIYDKYLSEECIDGAIAYYTSESGREISENITNIQQDLITLGMDMIDKIMENYESGKVDESEGPIDFGFDNEPIETKTEFDDFKKRYGLE